MSFFGKSAVVRSADFLRVRDLPVRGEADYPADLEKKLSDALRAPGGTQTLFPLQARALWDLGTYSKGFFPIPVGGGKTLISFLAPRVMNAERPVLLVPAALLQKTEAEWRASMKHWNVAKHLRFVSYEILGRASGADLLEKVLPDMVLADEVHKLKNPRAACTRRVARYMAKNPDTIFVPMSGTIMKDSIKNFAHLMEWSHRATSVLPLYAATLLEWSEALDEGVNPITRRDPGVLLDLYPGAFADDGRLGEDNNARARRVFQLRAKATPGIISSNSTDGYTGSLQISAIEYTPNAATEANFSILRQTMCRPDGWALSEAMQAWRVARELSLGLHYAWDPAPPQEWLDARKAWAQFVRDFLASPRSIAMGIDSEFTTGNAVRAGDLEDEYDTLADWMCIRPTFQINSVPVWHDQTALKLCADWLASHRGICWVEHKFFARELSKMTGLKYYGAKGLAPDGEQVEQASGPIIVSIAANSAGRNLQYKWSENLVTAPPSDSERWEQCIGRTHRTGQTADSVSVEVLVGCREHLESIPRALSSASVKKDMWGSEQKIRLADITWPSPNGRSGFRWA